MSKKKSLIILISLIVMLLAGSIVFIYRNTYNSTRKNDVILEQTEATDNIKPKPDRDAEHIYESHPNLTPVNYESQALLLPSEDATDEYIDNTVFLCDSPTYWLKPHGLLKGGENTKQIWTGPEGTQTFLYYKTYKLYDPYDGNLRSVCDMLKIHKPPHMFLSLGINGVGLAKEDEFIEKYTELVNDIKSLSPKTVITLGAIYPISPRYKYWHLISNDTISRANSWILKIAENTNCKYLDTFSFLLNDEGNAKEELLNNDGFHLNKQGLKSVLEYMKTHANT